MNYLSEVYGKGGIYARCVAASVANGIPIYTLETKAPKFIDAECEKHRMISTNSSSSRAIPFKKLDEVYIPFDVRANQKGMQGYEKAHDRIKLDFTTKIKSFYKFIADNLTYTDLHKYIHKQHLNRYLEPWMYQKKVWTATEWANFFNLRLAPDVQPEMFELARCMKQAIEEAELTELKSGEWHLPYALPSECLQDRIRSSVAGCARVSYGVVGGTGKRSLEKDLELAERLIKEMHMTPTEHQATPMEEADGFYYRSVTHMDRRGNFWSGNFRGWIQYRQLVQEWN